MVILKNVNQYFKYNDFLESFLKNKEHDCTLYSSEGMKFSVHKEIFLQSKLIQNILNDANSCCKDMEFLCPCSIDELEKIMNFLYSGQISYLNKFELFQVQENLIRIFGFPENIFSVENQSKLNVKTEYEIEEEMGFSLEEPEEIFDEMKISTQNSEVDVNSIDTKFSESETYSYVSEKSEPFFQG